MGEGKGKIMGKKVLMKQMAYQLWLSCSISEASVLVTSVNIHKGDYGAIIVGGRETDLGAPEESIHRYVHTYIDR